MKNYHKTGFVLFLVLFCAMNQANGAASLWNIADTPLFLAKPADPLITIIWDDSGSMYVEKSPESTDYSNIAFPVSFGDTSTYYSTAQFGTGTNSKLVRDPKQNALFFDPFKIYQPWINADGTLLPNATYTALWKSPFKTHPDDQYIQSNSNKCTTMNIASSSVTPCYSYTYCNGLTNCQFNKTTRFTPGNFYYNGKAYSLKNTTTNYAAGWFYAGSPAIKTSDMLPNVANWYTYYRDRKNTAKAALSYALQNIPENINLGFTTLSYAKSNANKPLVYTHQKFTGTSKQNLFNTIFNEANAGSTPLREALLNVNNYIKNTDSLWFDGTAPLSCRRAYNIIVTDGAWSDGTISFNTNSDGTAGTAITGANNQTYTYDPNATTSYKDSYSATLADIAMDFWKKDLRPDLDNTLYATPDNQDQAFWQHIVTNAISLNDSVPTTIPSSWPDMISSSNSDQRYLDLWHATLNSKGGYIASTDFTAITNALKTFLNDASNLTSNVGFVNTGMTINGYQINSSSKLFKVFFNPITWSGDVKGYNIDSSGNVVVSANSQPWVASNVLPAPADRQMLVMFSGLAGLTGTVMKPLQLTSLTSLLPATDLLSADVLNYYRGDRSNEGYQYDTNTQGLRTRSTPLGDFINSKPVFVGAPNATYSDAAYSTFKTANANRTPVLYAADNNGFLHGFNANTGVELFSVTPKLAYYKLAAMAQPGYTHTYSIDGTPRAGDAYFNNQWNTILVTPMGAGGQGLFSINITNPSNITEANAATLTGNGFWQFDDSNDKDLGNAYSETSITRINNTTSAQKWAVIFGNGYNNTKADTYKSTTGNAVLYVLNAQDGSIIKKLDTGVGMSADPSGLGRPNGLSTPTVIDYDGDGIADYVYAGDMFGDIWKFDIRGADPATWTSVRLFNNTKLPVQSITTAVEVKKFANGQGVLVYAATGRFIGSDDATSGQQNSIYGVLDNFSKVNIANSDLVAQTLTNAAVNSKTVRTLTNNSIPWDSKFGWYIDLPVNEMVINKPKLSQGYLLLSSYIPDPNNTVCVNNQKGFIYTIDPTTGGRLTGNAIDINGDGNIDDNDKLNNITVSGIQINTEYSSDPVIMQLDSTHNKLLVNTQSGNVLSIITTRSYADPKVRSWKKVRSPDIEKSGAP